MATQLIYIAGDVHADWATLNIFINKKIKQNKKFRKILLEYEKESKDVEE